MLDGWGGREAIGTSSNCYSREAIATTAKCQLSEWSEEKTRLPLCGGNCHHFNHWIRNYIDCVLPRGQRSSCW